MSQSYIPLAGTDTITASRGTLNNNFDALASQFSGTSFPTSNLVVGMRCMRTDLNKLYQLTSTGPAVWALREDFALTPTSKEYVDAQDIATAASMTSLASSTATNAVLASGYAQSALIYANSIGAAASLPTLMAAQRAIKLSASLVADAAFGYDTTRDDIPDWPKKCVSQSFLSDTLNTATRGVSAAIPSQMFVQGEASTLSIFAGNDGIGGLWKSWTVAGLTCVGARSGFIFYGTSSNGIYILDLVADQVFARNSSALYVCNNQNVSTFNQSTATWTQISAAGQIANIAVNSVCATVLPLTPPNPLRFGLPNPTVGIGSAGVTNIIRWDGVVTSSDTGAGVQSVCFDDKGNLWKAHFSAVYMVPPAMYQVTGWSYLGALSLGTAQIGVGTSPKVTACGAGLVAVSGSLGLATIKLDPTNPANSLYRVKTTTYDSGWMVLGKTVLAMAESSADPTTLVADTTLNETYATDPGGWTMFSGGVWSVSAGAAKVSGSTVNYPGAYKDISTTVGRRYKIVISGAATSGGGFQTTAQDAGGFNTLAQQNNSNPLVFVATTTTSRIRLGSIGDSTSWISWTGIKIVSVANDVSGSVNSPAIVGSVTRAQVASGADCAGYGFSAGNNLQSGNTLNGATDAAIVGWWSPNGTAQIMAEWTDTARTGDAVFIQLVTATLSVYVRRGGAGWVAASFPYPGNSNYIFVAAVLRGAKLELYFNGAKVASVAISTTAFSNASAITAIGALADGTYPSVGKIALPRFLTYAPTPDQIAFMYADEAGRFVANAKELLSGANVQAVAFDPDTNQLAASNSTGGTDVFAGPGFSVRVANQKSTTGTNKLVGLSEDMSAFSLGAVTISNKTGVVESVASVRHFFTAPVVTGAQTITATVVKAARGWAAIGRTNAGGLWDVGLFNLTTGAFVAGYNYGSVQAGTFSVVADGAGWRISAAYSDSNPSSLSPVVMIHNAATDPVANTFAGDAATIGAYVSKLMINAGTTPATYAPSLSANDNHKAAAFIGGDLVVATGAGVDAFLGVKPGLRETAGGQGAPKRAFYDPTTGRFYGVTTDATPTVILNIPIPEGNGGAFEVVVEGLQRGGTATERDMFVIEGSYSRDIGGNVVVDATTRAIKQVTGTTAAVAAADTTNQTLKVTITGKAATGIIWAAQTWLLDSGLMSAA